MVDNWTPEKAKSRHLRKPQLRPVTVDSKLVSGSRRFALQQQENAFFSPNWAEFQPNGRIFFHFLCFSINSGVCCQLGSCSEQSSFLLCVGAARLRGNFLDSEVFLVPLVVLALPAAHHCFSVHGHSFLQHAAHPSDLSKHRLRRDCHGSAREATKTQLGLPLELCLCTRKPLISSVSEEEKRNTSGRALISLMILITVLKVTSGVFAVHQLCAGAAVKNPVFAT